MAEQPEGKIHVNHGIIDTGNSSRVYNSPLTFINGCLVQDPANPILTSDGLLGDIPQGHQFMWTNSGNIVGVPSDGVHSKSHRADQTPGSHNLPQTVKFVDLPQDFQRAKVSVVLAEVLGIIPGFYNSEDIHKDDIVKTVCAKTLTGEKIVVDGETLKEILRYFRSCLQFVEAAATTAIHKYLTVFQRTTYAENVSLIDALLADYSYTYKVVGTKEGLYESDLVLQTFGRLVDFVQLLTITENPIKLKGGLAFAANAVHRGLHIQKNKLLESASQAVSADEGITLGYDWHNKQVKALDAKKWASIIEGAAPFIGRA